MVIIKKKINNKIYYLQNNKQITDINVLNKIKKIYIPPAYTNVKIYLDKNLIATGRDSKNRVQYIYSNNFKKKRSQYKYCNLIRYAINKKSIDNDIKRNLKINNINKNKLIAIILSTMNICHFRIGNKDNETKYKSTGLTTLKKRHIKINADKLVIDFIGKKSVRNICSIDKKNNKEIYKILKNVYNDIKYEKEYIFQYHNKNKNKSKTYRINETDINNYLKKFNNNITSKNIRTWNANIIFLNSLKYNSKMMDKELKQNIKNALIDTSFALHNTPTVCKSSYIIPEIIDLYRNNNDDFINLYRKSKLNSIKLLMNILMILECK